MSKFYLKFGLDWLEEKAKALGFIGPQWKQELLNDLLMEGALRAWKGFDGREPPKPVWYLQGQRASLVFKIDEQRDDCLFCLGMTAGSNGYARQTKGRSFRVPGTWAIETMGRPRHRAEVMTLEEHLEALYKDAVASSSHRPAGGVVSESTGVMPPPDSPFAVLKNLVPTKSAPSTPKKQPKKGPLTTGLSRIQLAHEVGDSSDFSATTTLASPETSRSTGDLGQEAHSADEAHAPANESSMPSTSLKAAEAHIPPASDASDVQPVDHLSRPVDIEEKISPPPASRAESTEVPLALPERALEPLERPREALTSFVPDAELQLDSVSTWGEVAQLAIVQSVPALAGIVSADDPLDARRQRIARLEGEIARLQSELEAVPAERAIQEADELRRKLLQAATRLRCPPPVQLRAASVRTLTRTLNILTGDLGAVPPRWVVGLDIADDEGTSLLLGSIESQTRLAEAMDWIESRFAGAPPVGLEALPEPEEAGTIGERLDLAWQLEENIRLYREEFPPEVIAVIKASPSAGLAGLISSLRLWKLRLHPTAFLQLAESARGSSNASPVLLPDPSILTTLDEDSLVTLLEITDLPRARKFWGMASATPNVVSAKNERTSPSKPGAQLLRIEHVVTSPNGSIVASPVVIPEVEKDASYATLDFPIRLIASAPMVEPLVLRISSNGTSNVPRDAQLAAGSIEREGKNAWLEWTLSADPDRWEAQDGSHAYREETVRLPVTPGFANELRRRKQGSLLVEVSGGKAKSSLRFEQFKDAPVSLGAGTGQENETASQLIERHALGPQVDHTKLESIVAEGRHAFMVVAPRRFGKTTLFQHLAEHASRVNHEVVSVTLERDLTPEQGIGRVWHAIKETLEKRHNLSPPLGNELPARFDDESAWDKVRQFVKDRGFPVLHLMIDEAQVLVPRSGGERWGNAFKNFVENYLGRPRDGYSRVQVNLFGTVDLSVRMGQNCRDFLLMHGAEHHVFKELSLAKFLRTVSQGTIVSSKRARDLMVRWTNNLRTLYALLDRVREHLGRCQRLFLLDADVEACIRDLLSPDSPHSEDVWSYARAELSHRDEWEPVDSFPLAVAWALEEMESLDPPRRLDACARWLENELRACGTDAMIVRERLDASLRDLKTRGVLKDDGSFWRPLLREMIRRKPRLLQSDPGSQQALLRLAVDAVSCPEALHLKNEGGQAKVMTISQGNQTLAYRICPLETAEERRRFARTCAAIRTLRDRRTRVDGDKYLPRVSEAGFRIDDSTQGIIVYDWIEGERLDQYSSDITWDLRVHIVLQISQAVQALHGRDVLHCDISPRNILVDSRMNATLIDFGLARRTDSSSHTQLGADPYKAPEQVGPQPWPEKASDIYALGVLLLGEGATPCEDPDLEDLAQRMMSRDVRERPDIATVVTELRARARFDVTIVEQKSRIDDIIQDAPEWLWEDLMQFKGQAASSKAGRRRWDRNRAMEASHILNNLFARIVGQKQGMEPAILADLWIGTEISLAAVGHLLAERRKLTDLPQWARAEVQAVGHLRNAWSHPTERDNKVAQACKALSIGASAAPEAFLKAVKQVATQVDALLGKESTVVARFLSAFAGET